MSTVNAALDGRINLTYARQNSFLFLVYVRSYKPGELPKSLILHGKDYIVQRFRDAWGIDRSNEITLESIHSRHNLIALEGSEVIGWLGVQEDGELVNGCGGPGHSSHILIMLLKQLFQDPPFKPRQYYAFVPIDYLASAACCIKAGMHLPESRPAQFAAKAYGNKVVTLVKLVYSYTNDSSSLDTSQSQYQRLTRLKEAIKEYAKPSKSRQLLKLFLESWKRLIDKLSFLSLHLGIDSGLAPRLSSLIPKLLLSLPISFVYYILVLHILGHNPPAYLHYLDQKKSEQDRRELTQYLEISKDALKEMDDTVRSNNKYILDYLKKKDDDVAFYSGTQAKTILDKQELSIKLLSRIFDDYSVDLQNGEDSGAESIQKYTIILYYMGQAPPYNPDAFNKLVDNTVILPSNCIMEECVSKALEHYITGARKK